MARSKRPSSGPASLPKAKKVRRRRTKPANIVSASKVGGISYKIDKMNRGIMYPTVDPNFFISTENQQLLSVVDQMAQVSPQNVMVVGPQGCGKTELAANYAATYNRPLMIMNCATIREARDWFGFRDAKEGSVFWHKADFVRAVEMGNCVILLDEFNRLHTTLHNTLYPLLDARRRSWIEELEEMMVVGPNTVFFSTANIGFSHTGTFTMDSAMEDRWGIRIDVSFMEASQEKQVIVQKTGIKADMATKLCKLAKDVRRKAQGTGATLTKAISTRQLLQSAQLMTYMQKIHVEPAKALDYTIVPFYSAEGGADSEQSQVLQLIQGIFG